MRFLLGLRTANGPSQDKSRHFSHTVMVTVGLYGLISAKHMALLDADTRLGFPAGDESCCLVFQKRYQLNRYSPSPFGKGSKQGSEGGANHAQSVARCAR